jgi:hypothetical protein
MNCHCFYQHLLFLSFFVFLLGLFSMVIIFLFHLDILCFPCQSCHHSSSLDFATSSFDWFTLTILAILMLNVEVASIHTSFQARKAQSVEKLSKLTMHNVFKRIFIFPYVPNSWWHVHKHWKKSHALIIFRCYAIGVLVAMKTTCAIFGCIVIIKTKTTNIFCLCSSTVWIPHFN